MKNLVNTIFILLGLLIMSACQQKFEYLHPLTVSQPRVSMPQEGGLHVIVVNTEGAWTAELSSDVAWLTIDTCSGNDMGGIRVECEANTGMTRFVDVIVRRDEHVAKVTITQVGPVSSMALAFLQPSVSLSCAALNAEVPLNTDVTGLADYASCVVTDGFGKPAEWVSDIKVLDNKVAFNVSATNVERIATMEITAVNPADESVTASASLKIVQTSNNPYVVLSETYIDLPAEGADRIPISTNLGNSLHTFYHQITTSSSWVSVQPAEFQTMAGYLAVSVEPNTDTQQRECMVTIPYRDLIGNSFPISFVIRQNGVNN